MSRLPTSPQFQSTLPVGGATIIDIQPFTPVHYFNPRSPWGERLTSWIFGLDSPLISIHAPRGGSDRTVPMLMYDDHHFNPRSPWGERRSCPCCATSPAAFQSTLPVGGATALNWLGVQKSHISIHAPRGGSDNSPSNAPSVTHISIHAPRGGSDFRPRP